MTYGDDESFHCLKQCDSDIGHLNKVQSSKTLLWISNNNFSSDCSLVFCKKRLEDCWREPTQLTTKIQETSVKNSLWKEHLWSEGGKAVPFLSKKELRKAVTLRQAMWESIYKAEHFQMTAMVYCSPGRVQEKTHSNEQTGVWNQTECSLGWIWRQVSGSE